MRVKEPIRACRVSLRVILASRFALWTQREACWHWTGSVANPLPLSRSSPLENQTLAVAPLLPQVDRFRSQRRPPPRPRRRRAAPYLRHGPRAGAHGHPVCRSTRANTTGTARTSRLSPRNGLTAYFELSPGSGLVCPRSAGGDLPQVAPGSRRQDHTISPYAADVSPGERTRLTPAASIASRPNVS